MRVLCYLFALFVCVSISSVVMAEPVDINTASAEEIADALPGIGMKKAQAIIEYRQKNGAFKSAEDLTQVKGIGPVMIQKISSDIVVQ